MSQSIAPPADNIDARLPRRVRHETKRRRLEVIGIDNISKHMIRVSLGGQDLDGFTSLGFDDHVKLFFPQTDAGEIRPDVQWRQPVEITRRGAMIPRRTLWLSILRCTSRRPRYALGGASTNRAAPRDRRPAGVFHHPGSL